MEDIYSISKQENELIRHASSYYGEYFYHAKEIIEFIQNFITGINNPKAWIFVGMFTQVHKHLLLALLSVLRFHNIQAEMDLRQALEAIVLAAYGIAHPKEEDFIKKYNDGSINMKKVKNKNKKIYDWFECNYREYSKKIKNYKNMINEMSAHASLAMSPKNFSFENDEMKYRFFDLVDKKFVFLDLWKISNISLGFLDIIYKINRKFNQFNVVKNFEAIMGIYFDANHRLKNEIQIQFKKQG